MLAGEAGVVIWGCIHAMFDVDLSGAGGEKARCTAASGRESGREETESESNMLEQSLNQYDNGPMSKWNLLTQNPLFQTGRQTMTCNPSSYNTMELTMIN